jgi:putative two-component system response regulator
MAVIDVYDALVSERPYKKAFTHKDAVGIITHEVGTLFDPLIAGVFIKAQPRIIDAGLNSQAASSGNNQI